MLDALHTVYSRVPEFLWCSKMADKYSSIVTVSVAEQLYDRILQRISRGVYVPGQKLTELELSSDFGVSRTPVREALQRLLEYGLLEAKGRSIRVRVLSEEHVFHLFQVRRVLELEAVRLAFGRLTFDDFARLDACDPGKFEDTPEFISECQKFDVELHRTIAERSGNPLLAYKLRKLHDRVQLVCRPTEQRLVEHREIIAAMKGDDCEAAVQAMSNHLGAALKSQMENAKGDDLKDSS